MTGVTPIPMIEQSLTQANSGSTNTQAVLVEVTIFNLLVIFLLNRVRKAVVSSTFQTLQSICCTHFSILVLLLV